MCSVEILFYLVVLGIYFSFLGGVKLLATNQGPGPRDWKKSLHSIRPSWDAECDLSPWMGGSDIPDFSRLELPMGALGASSS